MLPQKIAVVIPPEFRLSTATTTKITLVPDLYHHSRFRAKCILHPFLTNPSGAMKIMLLLILLSLLLAAGFLLVYLWAARNGQFDDDFTPAVRILFDDKIQEKDDQEPEPIFKEEPAGNTEIK